MASVHFGRLVGPVGFARTVAIKKLHPQYAKDPEFVAMFLDEARLVSRIRHPNVVQTLDIVPLDGELFIVMEYVHGDSLSRLLKATNALGTKIPVKIAATTMANALHGLHSAHEAKDAQGRMLGIVHRDISPHNVIVGSDGVARVLDFGVAYAAGRVCSTSEGQIKGKIAYMSPEQLNGEMVDRLTDVYAASVVLWELLTGRRLFDADNQGQLLERVLKGHIEPPSKYAAHVTPAVEEVVMRGLARDPYERWATAREMAVALERSAGMATPSMVGGWVESVAGDLLAERAAQLAIIEQSCISEDDLTPSSISAKLMLANPKKPRSLPPPSGGPETQREGGHREPRDTVRPSIATPVSGFPSTQSLRVNGVEIDARDRALGSQVPPEQRAKRSHVLLAIASSCALGVLLGGFMLGSRTTDTPKAAAAPPIEARHVGEIDDYVPPAPSVAPAPPATGTGTMTAEVAPRREPAPAPRPVAHAIAAAATPAAVPVPAPAPSAAPRPAASAPHADPCNPPFTFDAAGHKKYKLECL